MSDNTRAFNSLKDLAEMDYFAKNYSEAEKKFTELISLNGNAELWLKLGLCKTHLTIRIRESNPNEATFCLKKAIELNPSDKDFVYKEFFDLVSDMIFIRYVTLLGKGKSTWKEQFNTETKETIMNKLDNVSKSSKPNELLPRQKRDPQYDLLEKEALNFFDNTEYKKFLLIKIEEGKKEGERIDRKSDPLNIFGSVSKFKTNILSTSMTSGTVSNPQQTKPFLETNVGVIVMLFLFWPVGLYLLIKYKGLPEKKYK